MGEIQHSFNEVDFEELEDLVERIRRLARKGDLKKVVQVGDEFHYLHTSYNRNVQLAEYNERPNLKRHVMFHKH